MTGVTYAAYGTSPQTTQTMLGNGIVETETTNKRLQVSGLDASKSGTSWWNLQNYYCASQQGSCTSNNGNVISQQLTAPKTASGTLTLATLYGYDAVNRITSAQETGGSGEWSQSFSYGNGYGNLTQSGGGLPSGLQCTNYTWPNGTINNQCSDGGYVYDGAGNMTANQGRAATYDAENRQASLTETGTTWMY